jgi:hypothetical protein
MLMHYKNLKNALNFFILAIAISFTYAQVRDLHISDMIIAIGVATALTAACCFLSDTVINAIANKVEK